MQRAAQFYQLIRYSYASGCDSFGGKPHSMWGNFPLIEQASRRLQKVVIENKDFEKLISAQDSEVSFFYCDPPYFSTEGYYENVGFTTAAHERLRDSPKNISGKFLVSYNDCPEIRELYGGYEMYSYERLNNIRQRFDGGSMFGEIRTLNIGGEPWFVGKDVATILGYKDSINALKAHVDAEDKMGWQITTPSRGVQQATIINESGLYSLILSSKLTSAKKFKRWVTSEVHV